MTEPNAMPLRRLEIIMNHLRWTAEIEKGAYVLRVGPHAYTLRTVGRGADDRGEYALVEPYDEPVDSGSGFASKQRSRKFFLQVRSAAGCRCSG